VGEHDSAEGRLPAAQVQTKDQEAANGNFICRKLTVDNLDIGMPSLLLMMSA
jgi:hypothetical protein